MKKILFILLSVLLFSTSCVDTLPEEVLEYENFYKGVDDTDNAIMGLYGQFADLAGQVVVLNELRADLLDVTPNASLDLQEINIGKPSRDNPWTDVSKFYKVIQTCNDLLYNFDIMLNEDRMMRAEYVERYSDVAALRSWVYFQLGIQFGKIPYITDPVITISDLDKYKSNELTLDELVPELIRTMENLPSLEAYKVSGLIKQLWDGYSLAPFFINKRCFLGDLYLFNNEYEKAAKVYRDELAIGEDLDATSRDAYRKNRLYTYVWTSGTPDWFQILYADGKVDDVNSLFNGWSNMFMSRTNDRSGLEEWIWFIAYDSKYEPKYPFLEL